MNETETGVTKHTFIGVKMVKAEPMTKLDFEEYRGLVRSGPCGQQVPADEDGYLICYPDGYESWSPKEVFEAAYFEIDDPTRITDEDVARFMGYPTVRRLDEKTTLVSVKTLTGFVQHEVSSCVDPENYSEEIGRKLGMERIMSKLYPCLGFVLQWAKNGLKPVEKD